MVHQCTKFHCYRTHIKQVIGTNNFYCLRLFVYKVVMFNILILVLGYICVQFFYSGY